MSRRVSTDDLHTAELALRHEADTYRPGEEERGALNRVADRLARERERRFLTAARRSMPRLLADQGESSDA